VQGLLTTCRGEKGAAAREGLQARTNTAHDAAGPAGVTSDGDRPPGSTFRRAVGASFLQTQAIRHSYDTTITNQGRPRGEDINSLLFPAAWNQNLDARCTLKVTIFHSLSITSIFRPMHEVVNVGKKITNYTV
jgi:hypothetical protein